MGNEPTCPYEEGHIIKDCPVQLAYEEQKARADAMEKQCSDFVEDVRRCLIILKLNWGTTKGYERIKEYMQELEAKK